MKAGKVVGIVVLALVIAGAGYYTFFGGSDAKPDIPPEKIRNFLCVNKACDKAFAEDELNLDDAAPYGEAGAMAIKCPACGQHAVFTTRKCPSCGEVYVPTLSYLGPEGDLKCPKCGKAPK